MALSSPKLSSSFLVCLVLSYALVQKTVVDVLMDFLTDDVHLSLKKAVVLKNMLDFVSAVFKFGVTHISESYTGPFSVISFCTAAYTMGLMLLWLRTWLILATVLIALGKTGEEPLREFFDYQLSEKLRGKCTHNNKRENNKESPGNSNNLWSVTAYFTGALIAVFWLGAIDEWSEKFKVSSLSLLWEVRMHLLFFYGSFCYYLNVRSLGSPLTTICRVLIGSYSEP
ncbi:hypothetical protein K1719_013022 [Acacia pycnantha]|nr:hypothetical protein K1719_013022 [Acacia pycnantha]